METGVCAAERSSLSTPDTLTATPAQQVSQPAEASHTRVLAGSAMATPSSYSGAKLGSVTRTLDATGCEVDGALGSDRVDTQHASLPASYPAQGQLPATIASPMPTATSPPSTSMFDPSFRAVTDSPVTAWVVSPRADNGIQSMPRPALTGRHTLTIDGPTTQTCRDSTPRECVPNALRTSSHTTERASTPVPSAPLQRTLAEHAHTVSQAQLSAANAHSAQPREQGASSLEPHAAFYRAAALVPEQRAVAACSAEGSPNAPTGVAPPSPAAAAAAAAAVVSIVEHVGVGSTAMAPSAPSASQSFVRLGGSFGMVGD
ncbi:MAG: hypothetical protein EOO41_04415, partial [Methanobacteriota archaeon]